MSRIPSGQKKGGRIVIEEKIVAKEFYILSIGVVFHDIRISHPYGHCRWYHLQACFLTVHRPLELLIRPAELISQFPRALAKRSHLADSEPCFWQYPSFVFGFKLHGSPYGHR